MYYLRMNSQRTVLMDYRWATILIGTHGVKVPWLVETSTLTLISRLSYAQELALAHSIYGRCDVEVRSMDSADTITYVPAPTGTPSLKDQFWAWFRVKTFLLENA
jgi:hypothetical protein